MRLTLGEQRWDILLTQDAIKRSISALVDICDSITRGKGERGNPPDSRLTLLEDIHDRIYKTIIEDLKSVLPDEEKKGSK